MSDVTGETNRRISPTRALREILQEKGIDHWYTAEEIRLGFEKRHIYDSERTRVVLRFRRHGWIEERPEAIRLRRADDPGQKPRALQRERCSARRGSRSRMQR